MAAGIHNLTIEQGVDYDLQCQVDQPVGTDLDLTNWTVESQIRKSYYDSSPAATFTCTITSATAGLFNMGLTKTQTSSLDPAYTYVYDVELTNGTSGTSNSTLRLLQGTVKVSSEVTR